MNFAKFTIYTAAGCIPWVLLLGWIGVKVGENWEEWRDKLHYFDYPVLAAVLALAVWAFIKWRRGDFRSGDDDPGADAAVGPAETDAAKA
jgi:membrane protein DedA with SNARE-associated domain